MNDTMARYATSAAKPVPEGMHTVTAHLTLAGASEAIAFYAKAFGAEEISRLPGPDGALMHAAIRIGDSTLFLTDEMPQWGALGPLALKGSPVTIHLYVPDADAVFAQALAAGAVVKMPLADQFWGDRYGKLTDPFGQDWAIASRVRDMTQDEMLSALQAMMQQGGAGCA